MCLDWQKCRNQKLNLPGKATIIGCDPPYLFCFLDHHPKEEMKIQTQFNKVNRYLSQVSNLTSWRPYLPPHPHSMILYSIVVKQLIYYFELKMFQMSRLLFFLHFLLASSDTASTT